MHGTMWHLVLNPGAAPHKKATLCHCPHSLYDPATCHKGVPMMSAVRWHFLHACSATALPLPLHDRPLWRPPARGRMPRSSFIETDHSRGCYLTVHDKPRHWDAATPGKRGRLAVLSLQNHTPHGTLLSHITEREGSHIHTKPLHLPIAVVGIVQLLAAHHHGRLQWPSQPVQQLPNQHDLLAVVTTHSLCQVMGE